MGSGRQHTAGFPHPIFPGTLIFRRVPPCLFLSSLDKGLDMILRRVDEGALKCALRDLRLDDETVALYFMAPCDEKRGK